MVAFIIAMLFALPALAAPYELDGGAAITVTVRADVVNYDEEIMDTANCDYETNEACQMITYEVPAQ